MQIYNKVDDLIGNTPLIYLNSFSKNAKIAAKLEFFNPAGSIKDRVAKSMLDDAEEKGFINKNTVIIEPTSGNTGIGLAAVCASRGYKIILTMPSSMSIERRNLLKAYGAKIVLTEAEKGMQGAIDKAEELHKEISNSFIPSQFTNQSNPEAHKKSTGIEIWNDTDGKVDIFIARVGTGGTLTGIGEYLKSKNPNIKIVAVEPYNSPMLSQGKSGLHKIQGIGAGFIPEILNTEIYDEVVTVKDDEAFDFAKKVAKQEGILVGISSGAALACAYQLAQRTENKDKLIVVIFPDSGERYLSTPNFI